MPRHLETMLSSLGLIALAPLFLLLALAVKLQDGGPVLYRARRVGREGVEFLLLKFRSMSSRADRAGSGLTRKDDPRVTPVGRIMRRYKLDELPQLVNVLKGDMGFVGPRPEDPRFVQQYTPSQRQVLRYRPGITSPASLFFRNEEALLDTEDHEQQYVDQILPRKLTIDLEYMQKRTLRSDLRLILQTVMGV